MAFDYKEIYTKEQYINAIVKLISSVEGFRNKAEDTKDGEITIGFGYTFGRDNNVALWTAAGITLSPTQLSILQRIDNASTKEEKNRIAFSEFRTAIEITSDQAQALLRQTYSKYEGPANDLAMPLSPERVAFVALTYNRSSGIVRNKMKDFYQAIQNGDRAEAWYQIRYYSFTNMKYAEGLAKARYLESQLFGLYKNSSDVSADEAKNVYKMFQHHRSEIYNYENKYGERFDGEDGTRNMIEEGNNDYQQVLSFFGLTAIDTIIESLNPAKDALFTYLKDRSDIPDLLKAKLTNENIISTNIYLNPHKATDTDQSSFLDARPYETGIYAGYGANDLMIGMDQTDIMFGRKGNDILIGEGGTDFLHGNEGNDIIVGGDGIDVLDGGPGNDTIYGGTGNDTYIVNANEGTDTLEDFEGDGRLIFCGREINRLIPLGDGTYATPDGKVSAKEEDNALVLTDIFTGTKVILNENFEWGDFGITLKTFPTAFATPNPPITGDLTPILTAEGEYQYNQWGNVIVDSDQPAPGRADALYDTSGDDLILGGGGDDHINTVHGGSDKIQGGSGNDLIAQKEGDIPGARGTLYNAIIEGGTGSDIILGHYTVSNQLFGDSYGEMSALITHGDEAPDNELKGDFISDYYLPEYGQSTSAGYLYGSDGRDILINNTGMGVMAGGAGNDLIYGDFDGDIAVYANNNTWDYSIDITTDESGDTTYTSHITGIGMTDTTAAGAGKDDVIYGGTGHDFVLAGGGDDEVYGGQGSDTIFGEAGADFIEGGAGDDFLFGDNTALPISLQGADYIDGGAGNDRIEGYGGDDELFGGAGEDTIFGGAGNDYLDGEADNDVLAGAEGADIIFGGEGNDSLYGDASNVAEADKGDDYIDGESGNNYIFGDSGNDTLYAAEGNDTIYGGAGNDYIDAGDGTNQIYGGADNDDIWAGTGNDWIQGDAGNDTIYGGKIILFRKKLKYQNIWRRFSEKENLMRRAA